MYNERRPGTGLAFTSLLAGGGMFGIEKVFNTTIFEQPLFGLTAVGLPFSSFTVVGLGFLAGIVRYGIWWKRQGQYTYRP